MYGGVKPLFFSTVILYDLQMADEDKKFAKETEEPNVTEVLEGEVVSENSRQQTSSAEGGQVENSEKPDTSDKSGDPGSDVAQEVMNLENMIKTNNTQIAKLSADLTEAREMLKDAFENDTTYCEHADAAKDANKVKAATKAQILKQPQVAQIATNVKVLSSELKELKEALSDYLGEYNRLSGITEIEGDDGELLQIVYVAKLVRKTI